MDTGRYGELRPSDYLRRILPPAVKDRFRVSYRARAIRRRRSEFRRTGNGEPFAPFDIDLKLAQAMDYATGGYYVEVGANDGFTQSSTLALETYYGWHGVLIEPIASRYAECRKLRGNGNDVIHCACVASDHTQDYIELNFCDLMTTVADSPLLNLDGATHANEGAQFLRRGDMPTRITSPAKTLDSILASNWSTRDPSLLIIDVEGYELQVLSGWSATQFPFDWVCVETRGLASVEVVMLKFGYKLVDPLSKHDFLFKHDTV